MKVHLALAAAIAQVTAGHGDAVFPANGARVSYAIHETMPRGGAYDTTLTLAGSSAQSLTVSAPGKGSMQVALDNGHPSRMDRELGMGFHLLEVTNEVVQAGLSGASTVSVPIGPPGSPAATLRVTSAGGTITATGTAMLPPPPPPSGGGPQGPPPPHDRVPNAGNHQVRIEIVAVVAGGKLSSARGAFAPIDAQARGPQHTWTLKRTP